MGQLPEKRLFDPEERDSVSRLPAVKRDDLDDEGKKVYDACADPLSKLHADLRGPPGFWLHIPQLLPHIREINWYLRNAEIGLERRLRELTILVTARENNSQYEWTAHEPRAVAAGLEATVIDTVKHRKPLTGLPEKEAAIIAFGRELFREKSVNARMYDHALARLGQQGVVHMVALMSNYAMTALIFHAIGQQLRPGQVPLLPIP